MLTHVIIRRVRRRRPRWSRAAAAALSALALGLTAAGCGGGPRPPQPVGDPDPGHRRAAVLNPVLTAVPLGAGVTGRQSAQTRWDSCDGVLSTFGWDPLTAQAEFAGGGSAPAVVAHVQEALRTLGWSYDGSPTQGQYQWHRAVPGGAGAQAELYGPGVPDGGWMLQASAPPATHPSDGC
ncbi:hypothetical protein ABH931_001928 [Streptacidiphilus sp. MAP12-33]|uniref:hypothetical protein n=1 Tax=Streptacidiphilus sp. MAP12-33 TaxID=3156266 RepID=UPI003514BD08